MQKNIHINADLLKACIKDDRRAIEQLYTFCFRAFMPVCARYHTNEEDARSSLNTGFIKILKSLEGVGENVNFIAWAKRIIVNTLIDDYRKNKLHISRIAAKETERELELFNHSHSNEAEGNFGYAFLLKLVETLPEVSQKVFNLYVMDGYSHQEIGEILGINEGTSKWHLSTARKILREKLDKIEQNEKRLVV